MRFCRGLMGAALVARTLALNIAPAMAANQLPFYFLPWTNADLKIVTQGNNSGSHSGVDAYAWDFGGSFVLRVAAS